MEAELISLGHWGWVHSGEVWSQISQAHAMGVSSTISLVRGGTRSPVCCSVKKVGLTKHGLQMVPISPCGSTDHGHQHRPQLQQDYGPKHGLWLQLGPRHQYGSGGSTGLRTPTWSQVAGQKPGICTAVGGNRNYEHQFRPLPLQVHGPRHDVTMAPSNHMSSRSAWPSDTNVALSGSPDPWHPNSPR